MKQFAPVYCRLPNKLIEYKLSEFNDGAGNCATLRSAVYNDKNKKQQEIVAQVMWHSKIKGGVSNDIN